MAGVHAERGGNDAARTSLAIDHRTQHVEVIELGLPLEQVKVLLQSV